MTRKEAREFMMQVFFQMEATGDFDVNNRAEYMNPEKIASQKDYCHQTLLHCLQPKRGNRPGQAGAVQRRLEAAENAQD